MPTKTKADAEPKYRTGTELHELTVDWKSEQYSAQTGDSLPELKSGDYVRIQDVSSGLHVLYPDARLARVWGVKDGYVHFDLLDDKGCFTGYSTVRSSDSMEGVVPRGF